MISRVLQEISNCKVPVTLASLSEKLIIEPSALDGMLVYWVRKGRIREDDQDIRPSASACVGGSCGSSCTGTANCPFMATMPRVYVHSSRHDRRPRQ